MAIRCTSRQQSITYTATCCWATQLGHDHARIPAGRVHHRGLLPPTRATATASRNRQESSAPQDSRRCRSRTHRVRLADPAGRSAHPARADDLRVCPSASGRGWRPHRGVHHRRPRPIKVWERPPPRSGRWGLACRVVGRHRATQTGDPHGWLLTLVFGVSSRPRPVRTASRQAPKPTRPKPPGSDLVVVRDLTPPDGSLANPACFAARVSALAPPDVRQDPVRDVGDITKVADRTERSRADQSSRPLVCPVQRVLMPDAGAMERRPHRRTSIYKAAHTRRSQSAVSTCAASTRHGLTMLPRRCHGTLDLAAPITQPGSATASCTGPRK